MNQARTTRLRAAAALPPAAANPAPSQSGGQRDRGISDKDHSATRPTGRRTAAGGLIKTLSLLASGALIPTALRSLSGSVSGDTGIDDGIETTKTVRGAGPTAARASSFSASDASASAGPSPGLNRRKFLSYTSSEWERIWLANIPQWEKDKSICEQILSDEQMPYLREFLFGTCTYTPRISDWCLVDSTDASNTHWLNILTLDVQKERPEGVTEPGADALETQRAFTFSSSADGPTLPENAAGEPRVYSKFVFLDETTGQTFVEYIEPLISHLRHPLAKCKLGDSLVSSPLVTSRAYIVPPPSLPPSFKAHYFDAGASNWFARGVGLGGPSMSYFTKVWKRYGIEFDHIEGWEGRTSPEKFMGKVPEEYKDRVTFHQQWITSDAAKHRDDSPFVPLVIRDTVTAKGNQGGNYVLFKLDIDSGDVERGNVDYMLDPRNRIHIDEFLWEHHVEGNYLMMPNWKKTAAKGVSLYDSYLLFLALRRRGVRAHSWV